jgi:hypothetical protein
MVKQFTCSACGEVAVVRTIPPLCAACGGAAGTIESRKGEIVYLPATSNIPWQWPQGVPVV